MIAGLLVAEYDETGRGCEEGNYGKPDWSVVEESIRRLDRFRFPYVWLLKDGPADGNQLVICGGRGKFHLHVQANEGEFIILNAEKGNDLVEVWESDQGFEAYDFELLDDLDDVLEIAEHYYKYGRKHPDFDWVDT